MRAELRYISAACNSFENTCDWGSNDLISYGFCNSILIYNPKYPGTNVDVKVLNGHTDKVCSVKWIKTSDNAPETEIISCSKDSTAIVWTLKDGVYSKTILKGHTDGLNRIDALYLDQNRESLLIASTSIDSTVKLWLRKDGQFTNIQTIDFNRGLCVGLSLTFLPNTNNILMACGRDTANIELYLKNNADFALCATLKGHENWIPGLNFTIDNDRLLLASSSQDKFIRIWRIESCEDKDEDKNIIKPMKVKFETHNEGKETQYEITVESVIWGHEGWVYDVKWCPKIWKDGKALQPMKLLSCSLDKTMILWEKDTLTGLWMDKTRVGEVGGNTLGFYGCCFSPDAQSILGHGYLGSFHLWNYDQESDTWKPGIVQGGHSKGVVDLKWEPKGQYFMSVSQDQTTRIHAPWVHNKSISWHEIARPQVHGYDMSCLALLSRYRFASGAEEKIVRIFEAPLNFVENFQNLSAIKEEDCDFIKALKEGPRGASVPSLGLSNKAIYDSTNEEDIKSGSKDNYAEESYFHEVHMKEPPTEEDLIQNTLWPEVQKLYGHGYEIFAIASSSDGKLLATSCRATTAQHASIILWDTELWEQKQVLPSHTLTVTQIEFSPDNSKILSVSRDRRLSVFELENNEYHLAATTDKKTAIHSRIIWCCAWTHDSKYFVTGSRDGKIVIWTKNLTKTTLDTPLKNYESVGMIEYKDESVTAIGAAPGIIKEEYLFCLGFESGKLKIIKWNERGQLEECLNFNESSGFAHHQTVKRIKFSPVFGEAGSTVSSENSEGVLQIASAGADHAVLLHNLFL